MKKVYWQIYIVAMGIVLSLACMRGVRNYFYNNYGIEDSNKVVYNNFSNLSTRLYSLDFTTMEVATNEQPVTTTTTTTTTTSTTKTTIKTTTFTKTSQALEDKVISNDLNMENFDGIYYDGLTIKELTDKLNRNLNSTLSNTGYYFASYYAKTGLDPYLAVAIVLHETGCKWNCSKLVRECNNIGGIKGSPKCNGGSYRKYDSLEEGIVGYLDMLYKNYYSIGLTTPELINPKYAASTTWSEKVNNYIEQIKAS